MQLFALASWQEADSLAVRTRLSHTPVICSIPQEGVEKLDLGEECDGVIPGDGCDIGCVWRGSGDEVVVCTLVPYRPRRSPSPHPSNSSSICLQAAAAVMALLLGYGLVTLPEMLLQPPASVKQSPQHFSRRLPNALSKCSHPEQKLNIQGPQTITILSPLVFSFFFFPSVNINFSIHCLSLLYCRYKTSTVQGCHLFSSKANNTVYLHLLFCNFFLLYYCVFFSLLSLLLPVSVLCVSTEGHHHLNWHRVGQDSSRLCLEFG